MDDDEYYDLFDNKPKNNTKSIKKNAVKVQKKSRKKNKVKYSPKPRQGPNPNDPIPTIIFHGVR